MSSIKNVRLGVVGLGGMGGHHARQIQSGASGRLQLCAVCDHDATRLEAFPDIPHYTDADAMMKSGDIEAIFICTPHYAHTTIGIKALEAGLHVLVEKPISVHKADCERLIAAHANKDQVFAAMFNMRCAPVYIKLRELIKSGALGKIDRINWVTTEWFRTDQYYASGDWRATWKGEGGGVLLNQCPHHLDLWQWLFGMPDMVRAFCKFGRFHDIEVEDAVTAYMEYADGATGVFITTTGETPGSNRLEIAGDRGKVTVEGTECIRFTRNETSAREFCQAAELGLTRPGVWNIEIPITGENPQHAGITANFADAILEGKPLIAPAAEGVHSVELANAMLYSTFTDSSVKLPLSGADFEAALKKKIESSTVKKVAAAGAGQDFSTTFNVS